MRRRPSARRRPARATRRCSRRSPPTGSASTLATGDRARRATPTRSPTASARSPAARRRWAARRSPPRRDDLLGTAGRGDARFASEQVFASGAYAAVVEVERATGRVRRAAAGRGRRRRPDRQPAARRGPGDRRRRPGPGRVPDRGGRPRRARAARSSSLLDYALLTAAEIPRVRDRVRRDAVAAEPARARRASARAARSARPPAIANALADALGRHARPAVHRREGLAGAAVILDAPRQAWAALSRSRRRAGPSPATPASCSRRPTTTRARRSCASRHGSDGPVTATVTATLEAVDGRTRLHVSTRDGPRAATPRAAPRRRVRCADATLRRRESPRDVAGARVPRGRPAPRDVASAGRRSPAPFEYVRRAARVGRRRRERRSLERRDEDARVLAGGQSLVPLLNLRLARPRGSSTSTGSPSSA